MTSSIPYSNALRSHCYKRADRVSSIIFGRNSNVDVRSVSIIISSFYNFIISGRDSDYFGVETDFVHVLSFYAFISSDWGSNKAAYGFEVP